MTAPLATPTGPDPGAPGDPGAASDVLDLDAWRRAPVAIRSADEPKVEPPYQALPPISPRVRARLEAEALRVNDRYLHEFIEEYAFCPFARSGRLAGQTSRYVHYADSLDVEPLVKLLRAGAADPNQVVSQVILPLVEVDPDAWIRFVGELTDLGNRRLGGPPTLAFAALHPRLAYHAGNEFALVPLFRRAPDATIQWARLDALAGLYEGRESGDTYVDPSDVLTYVRDNPAPRPPLYDRATETNAKMARRLGLAKVEAMVADYADDARRSYQRILLEEEAPGDEERT
jgi:hypothetical protein